MFQIIRYEELVEYIDLLFDIYKPFAHRTFYPSTQDLPYNQSPEEGKSPPFIREMSSDRIISHSQLSISSTTSTTISNPGSIRNPLMTPGSILSWENMEKWRIFVHEHLTTLKREKMIWCLMILSFVISALSINIHHFHISTLIDCISSIISILSLQMRYKCYLITSDVLFSCAFFFNLIALFFTKVFPTTIMSIFIECLVIFCLSKWLVVFHKYSREDLLFYQAMSYSIQARKQDIIFLCQHGDIRIYVP